MLHVDDVMIFCKGTQKNMQNLLSLFQKYGEISGQLINPSKSTFFYPGRIVSRQASIASILVSLWENFTFIYLGVPIFHGKPRKIHLQPIADKIKCKLAVWKATI